MIIYKAFSKFTNAGGRVKNPLSLNNLQTILLKKNLIKLKL